MNSFCIRILLKLNTYRIVIFWLLSLRSFVLMTHWCIPCCKSHESWLRVKANWEILLWSIILSGQHWLTLFFDINRPCYSFSLVSDISLVNEFVLTIVGLWLCLESAVGRMSKYLWRSFCWWMLKLSRFWWWYKRMKRGFLGESLFCIDLGRLGVVFGNWALFSC